MFLSSVASKSHWPTPCWDHITLHKNHCNHYLSTMSGGKHKSTSRFRPHALNGEPFLHGRAANLANTCVAKGNLAAGTCGCSCKPSFPVGKLHKAFCEIGWRAQCWEWFSFWCPISMAGGWEGTFFSPRHPFCEHDFAGTSRKGTLRLQPPSCSHVSLSAEDRSGVGHPKGPAAVLQLALPSDLL